MQNALLLVQKTFSAMEASDEHDSVIMKLRTTFFSSDTKNVSLKGLL